MTDAQWRAICRQIIEAGSRSQGGNLRFAASYARGGLSLSSTEERKVQALYMLANLTGWRGVVARGTKDQLKAFANG